MNKTCFLTLLLVVGGCAPEPKTIVSIGDHVASTPSISSSYLGLLMENEDALFPAFAGNDLRELYSGGAELIRLGGGGQSFRSIADEAVALEKKTETPAVVVQLGANDLFDLFVKMMRSESARAAPMEALSKFRKDVAATLDAAASLSTEVYVVNLYDPTDGAGDVAAIATNLLPANIGFSVLTPQLGLLVLNEANLAIAEETERVGATLIDAHAHFLGHGYHFDEPENPHYNAADPSRWVQGVFDPTLRGAHELRRLVWAALSGAPIDAIPPPLPPERIGDLPKVPEGGWAKRVHDLNITRSIYSEETEVEYPNVYDDPMSALGPPDGWENFLAIGIDGAYLTVDLGEGGALDGEGADLVIVEFGALSGGTPEPYRVWVKETDEAPFLMLGEGRGEAAFDLDEVGLSSVRFVKVESTVSKIDVLSGQGSVTGPGPEIDAIGAVYPGGR